MNVGIFTESFEPVTNGVSVSVTTLRTELQALGHKVYVFAPAYRGMKCNEDGVIRFPSVHTPFAPDYPLAMPYLSKLIKRVSMLNLSVIHTQTPFTLGWLGQYLGRRLGIPVISTNHTRYTEYVHYVPLIPKSISRAFLVGMMRTYYNRCSGVIVPTNPVGELLREFGIKTPIYVIPTGVTIRTTRDPQIRKKIREEFGIPKDSRTLIYVGRLAAEKNLKLLFAAFQRLAREHQDIRLLIVGGGPGEPACRRMAADTGYTSRVSFTGMVSRNDIAGYYSAGDIFTFPSTTETQGIVLCEALGAGLPCVAVNAGGSAEMLIDKDDSLLCENSVQDFTSKIDFLLSNPAFMQRFSENAVKNAARFTPESMANCMLHAYESVCSHTRRNASNS